MGATRRPFQDLLRVWGRSLGLCAVMVSSAMAMRFTASWFGAHEGFICMSEFLWVPALRVLRGGSGACSPPQLPHGAVPPPNPFRGSLALSCMWFGGCSDVRIDGAPVAVERAPGEPGRESGAHRGRERVGEEPAGCPAIERARSENRGGEAKECREFYGLMLPAPGSFQHCLGAAVLPSWLGAMVGHGTGHPAPRGRGCSGGPGAARCVSPRSCPSSRTLHGHSQTLCKSFSLKKP